MSKINKYGVNEEYVRRVRAGKEKPCDAHYDSATRGAIRPRPGLGYLDEFGHARGAVELNFEPRKR